MMRGLCTKMNHETEDKWLKIADNMKIIYDEVLNYHPEYEGYNKGIKVKQADTILIGYPLLFPMNESTRRNDLNFYVHATRESGPAMTYSMFAINYLDIGDVKDANEMLGRSYKPYIRQPFNVWSEVSEGQDGAANFITGAGGFLQVIFNGFFGIRVHVEYLEIKNPRLSEKCSRMKIKGILYLNSTFEIEIKDDSAYFTFTRLHDNLIFSSNDKTKIKVVESVACKYGKNYLPKHAQNDFYYFFFQIK